MSHFFIYLVNDNNSFDSYHRHDKKKQIFFPKFDYFLKAFQP